MLKKLALAIFIITCAAFAPALAQTGDAAAKQAAIKELVSMINTDNRAEDFVNIMSANFEATEEATVKAMLDERTDLTAADKKSLEATLLGDRRVSVKRFQDKLMQKLDYSATINEIAESVYDKYYTLDEIRDLAAFYKTPTGQKSLKMMTPIAADTMRAVQERLTPKIPLVIKEIEDEDRADIERKINARKPKAKSGANR